MKYLLKVEYLLASLVTLVAYFMTGFDWYWVVLLFLAFDISAVGYFINPKIGAVIYNAVHSLVAPTILLVIYFVLGHELLLFITLLWLFHIFVDRAFGFGLKHAISFQDTHLGKIGHK